MLPGTRVTDGASACVECAGIRQRFDCTICGLERPRFRVGTCVQCSLDSDLTTMLSIRPGSDPKLVALRDALVAADRPESIYTWMRSPKVRTSLQLLGSGQLTATHESFDSLPQDRQLRHLRAVLVSAGLLPQRDEALHQFRHWIAGKVDILETDLRQPVERFGSWHHLRRIRSNSTPANDSHAAVHNAKQEITAAIEFLLWLRGERNRLLSNCRQADGQVPWSGVTR
jgi:hypothetical protein